MDKQDGSLVGFFPAQIEEAPAGVDAEYLIALPEQFVDAGRPTLDDTVHVGLFEGPVAGRQTRMPDPSTQDFDAAPPEPMASARGRAQAEADSESPSQAQAQAQGESTGVNVPVSVGDSRTVTITDIGEQGDGIAKLADGYTIIVIDGEVGHTYAITITQVYDSYALATIDEALSDTDRTDVQDTSGGQSPVSQQSQ